jgi:hypothetical protein
VDSIYQTPFVATVPFVVALPLSSDGAGVVVVGDPGGGAVPEVPRAITTPFVSPFVMTLVVPLVVELVVFGFELIMAR